MLAGFLYQGVERHDVIRVDRREVLGDCADLVRVDTNQLDNITFVARSSGGQFQLDQRRQIDVLQRRSRGAHPARSGNGGRRGFRGGARSTSFGKNVDLDIGFAMSQFRPSSWQHRQNLEPRNSRRSQEFLNSRGRKRDVKILGHAADITVSPDGPPAAQNGLTLDDVQQMIDRLDNTTVTTREVLRLEHACPPDKKFLGQRKTFAQHGGSECGHRGPFHDNSLSRQYITARLSARSASDTSSIPNPENGWYYDSGIRMITDVSVSPHRPSPTLMTAMMRMLLPLAAIFVVGVAPATAHYNMLLPDKHSVKKGEEVTVTYQWGHPFEHQLFDAPKPEHLWLFAPDGKSKELVDSLEKVEVLGDEGKKVVAYRVKFKPDERGDYVLVLMTPPIWLESDQEFVEDVVSVVVHVQAEKGWDRDEVHGPLAIRPLTRPYGLTPGSVFQVEVFSRGFRVGEKKPERATVEIERYNATPPKELPPEEQITRTVKTAPGGVATSTLTDPGWWAITARLDKPTKRHKRGEKEYDVIERATLWVPVDEKR